MFHEDPRIDRYLQAAGRGDMAVVREMLDSGIDVDAREEGSSTALLMAVYSGQVETVRFLLERGASPNPDQSRGYTALTYAIRRLHHNASGGNDAALLDLLLAAGARHNLIDAVLSNDVDLVRILLNEGGSPDEGEGSYNGPLLKEAAELGHVAMIDLLLDRGAKIEATDDLGQMALVTAARYGRIEVVERLLERGADINAVDWSGQSALSNAAMGGHRELVNLLLARGAERTIVDALAQDDATLFRSLVDEKLRARAECDEPECDEPDEEEPDEEESPGVWQRRSAVDWLSDGRSRLPMAAVGRGNSEIVGFLLDRGAVHLDTWFDDHSLLAEAARSGHIKVARLLIDRGADLHATGRDGLTPLDWAVREGREEVATLLRLAGAER